MMRRLPSSRWAGLIALAFGLSWLSGCGEGSSYEGPQRAPVKGKVTLDNEPVDGGTITFKPVNPDGRTASTLIRGGTYEIPEDKGPTLGNYKVAITWSKPINPPSEENPDAPVPSKEAIPEKFNKETTLEEEIQAGENVLDFELSSK